LPRIFFSAMRKQKKKNFKVGFTLIELILVMTVTIILLGAAASSMIRSQRTFVFNGAYQNIQMMVREARSFAVTGKAQPDYTDFDGDGCRNADAHESDCDLADTENDLVTPANYGVHFDAGGGRVILFADIQKTDGDQTNGVFDEPSDGTGINEYETGKDVILKVYEVPASLDLVVQPDGSSNAVFYSPIFADVSFETPASFFIFGLMEKANVGERKDCMVMHAVSGVPEEIGKVDGLTCSN
jgi:type II secretory pathway pseudopilin PulG